MYAPKQSLSLRKGIIDVRLYLAVADDRMDTSDGSGISGSSTFNSWVDEEDHIQDLWGKANMSLKDGFVKRKSCSAPARRIVSPPSVVKKVEDTGRGEDGG